MRIRSPNTFGVAGALEEGSQVFYDNLYTTQGLGRVSDLITARLKKLAPDELKIRSLLLHSVFESCREQNSDQPVMIECGTDSEKVALSVSFTLQEGKARDFKNIVERLAGSAPQDDFENLLQHLHRYSHRLLIRTHAVSRRVELLALVEFSHKSVAEGLASLASIEVVEVAQDAVRPDPKSYQQLADLDYSALLAETLPKAKVQVVQKGAAPAVDDEVVVSGGAAVPESTELVKGSKQGPEAQELVKGAKEVLGARERVEGAGDDTDAKRKLIAGEKPRKGLFNRLFSSEAEIAVGAELQAGTRVAATLDTGPTARERLYAAKIEDLQSKLAKMEQIAARASRRALESGPAQAQQKGIFGLLKKVWPFAQPSGDVDAAQSAGPGSTADLNAVSVSPNATETASIVQPVPEAAPDPAVSRLLEQIGKHGLDATIQRIIDQSKTLSKDTGNEKARSFIETSMQDLMKEKARINVMARDVESAVRTKENEFRSKELIYLKQIDAFKTDIVTKEKMLQHKDATIAKIKEQSTQNAIERTKTASAVANSKSKSLSPAEISSLQIKLERTTRQLDEYRKSNQAMTERLTELQSSQNTENASTTELKRRLEHSMKTIALNKKQYDKVAIQLEASKKEETRLKGELNRANTELNMARSASNKAKPQPAASNAPAGPPEPNRAAAAARKTAPPKSGSGNSSAA